MAIQTLRNSTSIFGLLGLLALAPAPAAAQDGAEEADDNVIVVTAQRREEASVDVPITVTTLGAAALETANVKDLSDISKLTPAVRFDFASSFVQPTIRGVGTAVTTSGGGANVGIYIDGFYSPNPLAADFNLMKVNNIQVLKGPQGTLFGRNTTGGAILVQTADPSTTPGGAVKLSYGRYNELQTQAYATMGISETVAIDAEGMYSQGDGWRTNISNGQRVGDYENWSVRLGLKAELSDKVSILLRYQHSDMDDPSHQLTASYRDSTFGSGAPVFAPPGTYTFDPDEVATGSTPQEQEFFRSRSDTFQATIKADLDFADLTSYSQFRSEEVDSNIEIDYSGLSIFQLGLPNDNETWSQEFLFTSKPGTSLQWTAGLFYFSNRDTYETYIPLAPPTPRLRIGGSSTTTESYAAFVDMTYELNEQWFLTAGARYSHDVVKDAYWNPSLFGGFNPTQKNPVSSIKDDRVTPRAVIRFKPNDDSSIYASYTKGYKAAIIDVGGSCQNAPFICNDVQPETIDAFEIGYKYDNRGLSVEVSGFYYDYQNLQISQYRAGTALITNAAASEIYGLDGQFRYEVSEHFQVNAGAAWTHARYKDFIAAPVYTPCTAFPVGNPNSCGVTALTGVSFPIIPTNLSDVTMQRTPEFTGNIGAVYKTDLAEGELALSGNLFYSSKFYFGPSGIQFVQKGYEVLSLRAQWTDPSDRFTIALWGDNVTDSRYLTQAQYSNFGIGANWSQPITYGIELGAKF
jgi:iron complex outermembrane recepter protein